MINNIEIDKEDFNILVSLGLFMFIYLSENSELVNNISYITDLIFKHENHMLPEFYREMIKHIETAEEKNLDCFELRSLKAFCEKKNDQYWKIID